MKYIGLLLVLLLQSCMGFSQEIIGSWSGKLDIGTQKLTFVVHIGQENGQWTAKADSPDQGAFGIPFQIQVEGDSVFLNNPQGIKLSLLIISQDKLQGQFSQSGMKIPVILARTAKDVLTNKVLPFQTPKPPYSYDTLDVVFPNKYANIQLAGTLTFPKEKGKYPAVILLTGSGQQDRDETLFGHKPFKVLADYLTRNGIIVLRYDDRGAGKSEGSFEASTIDDFSKDAISALEFLKQQKNVDINKIGILGHSEGGLVANLLAGQGIPNVSFIVTLAAPTVPIRDLMIEQLYSVGKAEGMSEFQLEMAKEINKKNFDVVKSELNTDEAFSQLKKNMNIMEESSQNEAIRKEMLMMVTPAYRYFVRIDPTDFIKEIYIPVFGAFGTLDVQVPSTLNLRGYYDHLPRNSKTVLKEYDGMNHLFQKAKTGRVAEYAQIQETINEQVLKDIAFWIKGL
ncbi:alpha/beta hydrolase family protein [Sphingobacterium sp. SGL-16]|uniref:alpha/beta hydrolase family protein n=1 Tax=Sphingobacterium sp. SGL-16 TaxID=2710883 RepID=UPI0013EC9F73|nr:alpha/beta fold hydrolase [Sphingobacterium sp. SGL-16]NGM72746.1 prolyl oligopeptidase family serine peptidase [Sphingobacterium sp. SGL-16]